MVALRVGLLVEPLVLLTELLLEEELLPTLLEDLVAGLLGVLLTVELLPTLLEDLVAGLLGVLLTEELLLLAGLLIC